MNNDRYFLFRIFDRRRPFLDLTCADFEKGIRDNSDAVILDVRTPAEFSTGKIPGAININITRGDFETHVLSLDRHKTYFVYCQHGNRSIAACSILGAHGIKSCNLKEGIVRWQGAIEFTALSA